MAAGLPDLQRKPWPRDIRLGDILVALPEGESPGLIAYDLGKETRDGFELLRSGHVLAMAERIVRSAIGKIKSWSPYEIDIFMPHYTKMKDAKHGNGIYDDPGHDKDVLYDLVDGVKQVVPRPERSPRKRTRVWYGSIGSGDKLIKNPGRRDELRDKYNVIGLERGAARTMNQIPVGVIRGVCDYGDEQENKAWQPLMPRLFYLKSS